MESELLDEKIPSWNSHHNGSPKTGEQLSELQPSNLRKLLSEFVNVLQDKPGSTSVVKHTFDTGTASPVHLPPYRVPHAYRNMLESELKDMHHLALSQPVVCTSGVGAEKRWFYEAMCRLP